MSKEIDWGKAPEGTTHYNTKGEWARYYKQEEGVLKFWVLGEWTLSMSKKDQLDLIEKPKLVYTQDMCDRGELPSVGMECMVSGTLVNSFLERFHGKKVEIVCHDTNSKGDPCAVFKCKDEEGYFKYHALVAGCFKPLPPKVELIDGKAYRFDSGNHKGVHGIFKKGCNLFVGYSGATKISGCTNIIPLIPESVKQGER